MLTFRTGPGENSFQVFSAFTEIDDHCVGDSVKRGSVMTKFKCTHSSGTNVTINQGVHGWRIQINLREPNHAPVTMTGYVTPTLASAKELAEKEILKFGHVCNACGG